MKELGTTILQRCALLRRKLAGIPGLTVCPLSGAPFEEFIVRFDKKTVAEVNEALLKKNILGGFDLSASYPELGQCELLCVTERTAPEDMDRLAAALREILA